jgi:molybdopterin-guanine dinucleotide biosynthesis protein MobB
VAAKGDQVVVGLLATSGTGKTTLLERLIPQLTGRGLKVGLVKHCSREFDIDHPGKDTYRLKAAGAARVVINNDHRLGLVADLSANPPFEVLLRRHFEGCDVVLVEGHRTADIPKIIVERAAAPRGLIDPKGLTQVIACVSDLPENRFLAARRFGLDDTQPLADFITHDVPARSGEVAGVILAGGKSTRLGTDKAEAVFEGATLLERTANLLAKVCRELWLIGRKPPEGLAALGVNWHLDLQPKMGELAGPLAGIYTALKVAQAPRCLVVGCDMPRLSEAVLRRLLAAPKEATLVIGRGPGGRIEPLSAIYSKALLPQVEELLASGQYRVAQLVGAGTHYIEMAAEPFFNVNTPQDWARLLKGAP